MAQTLDLGNVIGPKGEKGNDGATWLNGAIAPTAAQGKDGDFYINTATFDLYNKVSGTWNKTGNIKGATGAKGADGTNGTNGKDGVAGAAGADGATILFGTAAPTSQGKNGDVFLNTANFDLYSKASNTWTKIGNIKGAQGAKGDPGAVPTFSINASGHLIATYA